MAKQVITRPVRAGAAVTPCQRDHRPYDLALADSAVQVAQAQADCLTRCPLLQACRAAAAAELAQHGKILDQVRAGRVYGQRGSVLRSLRDVRHSMAQGRRRSDRPRTGLAHTGAATPLPARAAHEPNTVPLVEDCA